MSLRSYIWIVGVMALGSSACTSTQTLSPSIETTQESVQPGTSVKRAGQSLALSGTRIVLNQKMPEVTLTDFEWKPYALKADGRIKLISIVPSLDTQVCEQQTQLLAEAQALHPKVERIVVSRDLPAAQRRFAAEHKLATVTYLSDYRYASFGKATGLLMEESDLLARAIMIVDGEGHLRYMQVVPEITKLPDLNRAIAEANKLTGS